MFQNGIFTTFIPEIFMVLGFLICLITPSLNSTNQSDSIDPVIVYYQSAEYNQYNTFSVSKFDFQQAISVEIVQKCSLLSLIFESGAISTVSPFDITDFLSKVQFSHPPPILFS